MTKKILALMAMVMMTLAAQAVPAYRGWQTKTQPDGTTIQVRLVGDEFYHYWANEAGEQVRCDSLGYWQVVGGEPTAATVAARRAASPKRSMANKVGKKNLAPRGLVILVNFSNKSFTKGTQADFNNMMNADSYTFNGAYGSAKKYFSDQSNGAYVPTFDVVGPVTLDYTVAYYGANDANGDDVKPAQMVVDACTKADASVDFTQYDNDGDGKIDFVYVIYAGMGEADGGADETIWPHNWYVYNGAGITKYLDGKRLDNYACSGEVNGITKARCGIGTICHEFGHVLGLPDLYDTEYGQNYTNGLTPGDWSIMDGGSYNNSGNCPPNYSIFDKYFFGWATPTVLNSAANVTLGTGYTEGYYINNAGTTAAYTNTAETYYIENRQKSGWDAYLPGHGLLVWKVTYSAAAWSANKPNTYSYVGANPRYTVASAKGTAKVQQTNYDTYPGTGKKTSFTPFSQYPLLNITETNGQIKFIFIEDPACHKVNVSATNCTVTPSKTCVQDGENLTATIALKACCEVELSDITVTRGSTALTSGTHYSLAGNTLTIQGSAITGSVDDAINITVNARATGWEYVFLNDHPHSTVSSESGCATKNGQLQLTITPDLGYELEKSDIKVDMGGNYEGFTYSGNVLTIASVTADVMISVAPRVSEAGAYVFEPVTTTDMLVAGKKYILLYPATPAVPGAMSSQVLTAVTSGFEYDAETKKVTVPQASLANVAIWTLGGSTGAWTFSNTAGNQLMATAVKKLAYGGSTGTGTWTITCSSSVPGQVEISNTSSSYGKLCYNSGSPRFTTYSSVLQNVHLYRLDDGEDEQATTVITAPASVKNSVKVGQTVQNVYTTSHGVVVYSSSNEAIATVSQTGVVTGVKAGTATIYARVAESSTHSAAEKSYTITVNPLDVYTITWNNGGSTSTTSVTEGDALVLPADPAACTTRESFVGWTATAGYANQTQAPALVNQYTVPTGSTTYYAVFARGTIGSYSYYNVTCGAEIAKTTPTVSFASTSVTKTIGDATFTNALTNNGDGAVTYSSSNETVASVASNGQVTIKAAGTTTITAHVAEGTTYAAGTASYQLTVKRKTPVVSFPNGNQTLKVGETTTQAVSNSGDGAVSYSSSDASVASVNAATGLVTALKVGKTTITANVAQSATYLAGKATYTVTVAEGVATGKLLVTWMANGAVFSTQIYTSGDALALPAETPSACDGMEFKGWTATENYFNLTEAPAGMFTTASGTVTTNVTYYAVYGPAE